MLHKLLRSGLDLGKMDTKNYINDLRQVAILERNPDRFHEQLIEVCSSLRKKDIKSFNIYPEEINE